MRRRAESGGSLGLDAVVYDECLRRGIGERGNEVAARRVGNSGDAPRAADRRADEGIETETILPRVPLGKQKRREVVHGRDARQRRKEGQDAEAPEERVGAGSPGDPRGVGLQPDRPGQRGEPATSTRPARRAGTWTLRGESRTKESEGVWSSQAESSPSR